MHDSNNILNCFIEIGGSISELMDEDIIVGISDDKTFLKYFPGKELDVKAQEGSPLQKGDAMYECLTKNKKIVSIIPQEVFGIPFKSITIPIRDDKGKAVGTVSIGKSLKKQQQLLTISETLSASLQETTSSLDEISSAAHSIAASSDKAMDQSKISNSETSKSDRIVKYIKGISEEINLLGLNAAIEAAKAGQQGRGFSVVAERIRKLSVETNTAIENINDILTNIKKSVEAMSQAVIETGDVTKIQARNTQEILSALEEINSTSEILHEIAREL
ncbi:Methyl-accepting chemotaxis protein (MCP) signalling domain-containing protein [Natronincola peptidivorans]|uniref:Methyl-accepting chemotaxis protein (MCP) signalling domain-containing protein n=1 Tax=Natronincola peptidivorans TaxID=426128 RepID=A0A1H9Y8P1_9FIRM|nr:methyl-accepting chemotaxis protein [Natronincola peptidivorans]SES65305.1 Methyl-accepting chemotaxis protein (MCP) signalling domain-containing protein [Natronincola peptidivorans]